MPIQSPHQTIFISDLTSDTCSNTRASSSPDQLKNTPPTSFAGIAQDCLLHMTSFAQSNWSEGTKLALVSHSFKLAIDTSETRQIVHLFKQAKRDENLEEPPLPTDYFQRISFDKLKALLPENLKLEKALSSLFRYLPSILPSSEIEKLVLFLMKQVDWHLEEAIQEEWPENSTINPIIEELSDAFNGKRLNQIEWDVCLPYGKKAFFQKARLLDKIVDPRYGSIRLFALESLKRDGMALQHVHEDLKKDREIVMTAINENGQAIQFAHEKLQLDEDIGRTAAKQMTLSFQEFELAFLRRM